MEKLQSEHFTVVIIPPATSLRPVDGRKYILHRNHYGKSQLLTIGTEYDLIHHSSNRKDQLRLEWKPKLGEYMLIGKIYIEEETNENKELIYKEWIREIPSMLSLIIKSDFPLFQHVPWLLDAPIIIQIEGIPQKFSEVINWRTPRNYLFQ